MSIRTHHRAITSWTAITVAAMLSLAVTGTAIGQVSALPTTPIAVSECAADPTASADAAERFVTACRVELARQVARPEVVECLRRSGTTPDSIERWLSSCVALHP